MIPFTSCIYEGTVVHKRLTPRRHALAYRVFTLCLDIDEIDAMDQRLLFFSRSKRNFFGLFDADLGEPGPAPVGIKVRRLLDRSGLARFGARVQLVCYPRLLGFVFNPLSVYFCSDQAGRIGALIYEVNNTFGERKSYVIPVDGDSDSDSNVIAQDCAKDMYVSPFTAAAGRYAFHCVAPCERVVIGVNFREAGRPVLKTHFRGDRRPLTDGMIMSLMVRYPLMTLKVFGAIHLEAARLWAKGVPIVPRHASPAYSSTLVDRSSREAPHA